MVVLVDFEEASSSPIHLSEKSALADYSALKEQLSNHDAGYQQVYVDDGRPNPNINGFSAALSCYPIVAQLASLLDLNTLHDLSRTCRQFRANLLQFRHQLVSQTLRCENEDKPASSTLADRFRESHSAWTGQSLGSYSGRITSGKIGQCARDMVGECRRCSKVVCRNCMTKPPPTKILVDRHRRLCKLCARVPLTHHLAAEPPKIPSPLNTPNQRNTPSPEPPALTIISSNTECPPAFTAPAFSRTPCTCAEALWLCQPCGQCLRSEDTQYYLGWKWRTQYSHYLGGLGTGIGEGNEGVPCGRASTCFGAHNLEKELDVSDKELAVLLDQNEKVEQDGSGRSWKGGSWVVQECEGVGGGIRMKTKKQERIGAPVQEYEDERDGHCQPLTREKKGEVRSWCAWCTRVIPGQKEC